MSHSEPKRTARRKKAAQRKKRKASPVPNVKRELAVELLARGCSERTAADALKVARNTLRGWRDDAFNSQVAERAREILAAYRGRFARLVPKAISALESELALAGAPRVRSAIQILKTHGVIRPYEEDLDELGAGGEIEIVWRELSTDDDEDSTAGDAPAKGDH